MTQPLFVGLDVSGVFTLSVWARLGLLTLVFATAILLGYAVSGFFSESSLLITVPVGSASLAGGAFGLEGTIWITVTELLGIAVLLRLNRRGA